MHLSSPGTGHDDAVLNDENGDATESVWAARIGDEQGIECGRDLRSDSSANEPNRVSPYSEQCGVDPAC
jgi:hypothetical protein